MQTYSEYSNIQINYHYYTSPPRQTELILYNNNNVNSTNYKTRTVGIGLVDKIKIKIIKQCFDLGICYGLFFYLICQISQLSFMP